MGRMLRWVTATHTQLYHAHYHTAGEGHLYQSCFKSFPVADDNHSLVVCRYVERNPLRANLVQRAEDWRFAVAVDADGGTPSEAALALDGSGPRQIAVRPKVNGRGVVRY